MGEGFIYLPSTVGLGPLLKVRCPFQPVGIRLFEIALLQQQSTDALASGTLVKGLVDYLLFVSS